MEVPFPSVSPDEPMDHLLPLNNYGHKADNNHASLHSLGERGREQAEGEQEGEGKRVMKKMEVMMTKKYRTKKKKIIIKCV